MTERKAEYHSLPYINDKTQDLRKVTHAITAINLELIII